MFISTHWESSLRLKKISDLNGSMLVQMISIQVIMVFCGYVQHKWLLDETVRDSRRSCVSDLSVVPSWIFSSCYANAFIQMLCYFHILTFICQKNILVLFLLDVSIFLLNVKLWHNNSLIFYNVKQTQIS